MSYNGITDLIDELGKIKTKNLPEAQTTGGVALGETGTTAHRGDHGKTAYDHSQTTHAPGDATVGADWNNNVANIPSTFPPSTHSHTQSDITNLSTTLGDKVDKVTNYSLVPDTEIIKLSGIEAGAEVNNISDLNATDLTDGGETTLHSHPGGSGGLIQQQIEGLL